MSQDKRVLAIIEKMVSTNKYIETIINDTENTYIYHSEHGKNTCENCKALDNVKFYPGDLMVIPPLHPNCKCELEEFFNNKVQTNSNNPLSGGISIEVIPDKEETAPNNKTNEQQDENSTPAYEFEIQNAKKELESAKENLDEINSITKEINETIEKDIDFDFQVLDEQITSINPSFDMDLGILKEEKENHLPNCNELNKRINEVETRKAEFEKIKNNVEDNKKKVEELRKRLEETNHVIESFKIDWQFFMEKISDNKAENGLLIKISELISRTELLNNKSKQILDTIRQILNDSKILEKSLFNIARIQVLPIAKFTCNCAKAIADKKPVDIVIIDEMGKAVSPGFPIGGSNIQDAMHDFEYAKKNKNAEVFEDINDVDDEIINKIAEELKLEKGIKTVVYDENSLQSKKIYHSHAVQNYIKANLTKFVEADGKPIDGDSLEFQADIELDAYLGIQKFNIHNPRITKDGYFEATISDKYDFVERPIEDWKKLINLESKEKATESVRKLMEDLKNRLNNIGFDMQEKGLLEKYEVIYKIREKI